MNLTDLLAHPFADFDRIYAQELESSIPLIAEVNSYLSQRQGKRIRPKLTLLSAGATFGHVPELKIRMGVVLELLHNSSLIHDDVVDESHLRRNQPTLNSLWGNKIAVLSGDFYLSKVMGLLCRYASPQEMDIVNRTAVEMSEGELLQQQNSRQHNLDLDTYRQTIYKKTAVLLSACCELGQCPSSDMPADPSYTERSLCFRTFGMHFGMAFQMRDDMLDYMPTSLTGKPAGNDIKEHKMTLPLIYYLEQASDDNKNELNELLKQDDIDDTTLDKVMKRVAATDALQRTRQAIALEVDAAVQQLEPIPDSPYKAGLLYLTKQLKSDF